ncbi:MAG TPA: BRO family protein [Rhodoferax sp.]|nr:BRO family protein [Rhodoferax sp.]
METVQVTPKGSSLSEYPCTPKKPHAAVGRGALQLQTMTMGKMSLDVAMIGDDIWFYAPSLARTLEYSTAVQMLRGVPDSEKGVHLVHTLGGVQEANFLVEPGFYRVLTRSQSPVAEPFKCWFFYEVLPSLRKTGQYKMQQEAKRLGVSFEYTEAQWEWLKMRPGLVDLIPLALGGYNSVEITRMLNYNTKNGITARHQIDKLKELGFLPNVIEPRAKQLERRILAERAAATPAVALK